MAQAQAQPLQLDPNWPADINPDLPDQPVLPSSTSLRNAVLGLKYAVRSNTTSIQEYRNAVNQGLTDIRDVLNQLIPLINTITQQLVDARAQGNDLRVQQLQAQKEYLLQVVNAADQNVRTLLSNPNAANVDATRQNVTLAGVEGLNPALATTNLRNVATSLQSALTRAQNAANPGAPIGADATQMPEGVINAGIKKRPPQLTPAAFKKQAEKARNNIFGKSSNPFASDEADYKKGLPGARGGKMKKTTKKHQKKSKKTHKRAKTAKMEKKGKKQRGGYAYRKSKRRRNKASSSSSAALSSYSKNGIMF